jgi:hypothetical protein
MMMQDGGQGLGCFGARTRIVCSTLSTQNLDDQAADGLVCSGSDEGERTVYWVQHKLCAAWLGCAAGKLVLKNDRAAGGVAVALAGLLLLCAAFPVLELTRST